MANLNITRFGQNNLTGDPRANFIIDHSQEILAAYAMNTVYEDKQVKRTIQSGASAQFPVVGNISAEYIAPGQELSGLKVPFASINIPIDGQIATHVSYADLDEAMLHYEVRSHFTRKMGEALAEVYDKNVARNGILAARSTNALTGYDGGSVINGGANVKTDADLIKKAFFASAQILDEKNIPSNGRYVFVRPVTYYVMAQTPDLINKDWGGDGSISKGVIGMLAGLNIVPTNNMPDSDETSLTTIPAKHRGDFSKTAFHVMNDTAVGTVQLMSLRTEKSRETRFLSDFMVASFAVGHGVLRPEAAIEVTTNP